MSKFSKSIRALQISEYVQRCSLDGNDQDFYEKEDILQPYGHIDLLSSRTELAEHQC